MLCMGTTCTSTDCQPSFRCTLTVSLFLKAVCLCVFAWIACVLYWRKPLLCMRHLWAWHELLWIIERKTLCSWTLLVQVWNVHTKKVQCDLPGHADEVFTVDWSPDGASIASGGKDQVLKLWRHWSFHLHHVSISNVYIRWVHEGLQIFRMDMLSMCSWVCNLARLAWIKSATKFAQALNMHEFRCDYCIFCERRSSSVLAWKSVQWAFSWGPKTVQCMLMVHACMHP